MLRFICLALVLMSIVGYASLFGVLLSLHYSAVVLIFQVFNFVSVCNDFVVSSLVSS